MDSSGNSVSSNEPYALEPGKSGEWGGGWTILTEVPEPLRTFVVATFYLLPPRPLLAERFAEALKSLFPGVAAGRLQGAFLAEMLAGAVAVDGEVYVVHREDLPDGEDPLASLSYCFGAEAGDEVIEVHAGPRPGEWNSRRWTLKRGATRAA